MTDLAITQSQADKAFTNFINYAQTHLHWNQTKALHYWINNPQLAYQLGQQLHH